MTLTWVVPLALLIVVAVVTLQQLRRSYRGATAVTPAGTSLSNERQPEARSVLLLTRSRNLLAVGAAIGVGVIGFTVSAGRPDLYGLPAMLTPGVAAIAALLVVSLVRAAPSARRDGVRSADLTPRRPWSYGPRWAFTLPLVGAGAVLAFAVVTGLTSSRSQDGHWRSISVRPESSAGPYPGWYYAVPLMAVTVLLVGATLFALGRNASAPRPSDTLLDTADRQARARTTQMIMKLSSGAMFSYFGGVLFFAGVTTRNAARAWDPLTSGFERLQPQFAIGLVELFAGLAFGLLGLVLVLLSVVDALGLPPSLARSITPARADANRLRR